MAKISKLFLIFYYIIYYYSHIRKDLFQHVCLTTLQGILSFQFHIVVMCLLAVLPFLSFHLHVIATCLSPILSIYTLYVFLFFLQHSIKVRLFHIFIELFLYYISFCQNISLEILRHFIFLWPDLICMNIQNLIWVCDDLILPFGFVIDVWFYLCFLSLNLQFGFGDFAFPILFWNVKKLHSDFCCVFSHAATNLVFYPQNSLCGSFIFVGFFLSELFWTSSVHIWIFHQNQFSGLLWVSFGVFVDLFWSSFWSL